MLRRRDVRACTAALALSAGAAPPAGGHGLWHGTPCGTEKVEHESLARVIWCDRERPTVRRLAEAAAPILWFSPDEFLLDPHERRGSLPGERPWRGSLPEPFPFDQARVEPLAEGECPSAGPPHPLPGVVYFCVAAERAGKCQPREDGPADPGRDGRLYVEYFFYYERDAGLNGHPHDIEGAELELSLVRVTPRAAPPGGDAGAPADEGHWRVTVDHVKGEAHGLANVANRLQVRRRLGVEAPDLRVPVTLLVEEGKHASCPDRNGDGAYNPGYDVNLNTNDAWGVRDIFAQSILTRRYDASQTKARLRHNRYFPAYSEPDHPSFEALKAVYQQSEQRQSWDCERSYRLFRADDESMESGFRDRASRAEGVRQAERAAAGGRGGRERIRELDAQAGVPELNPLSHRWNLWKRLNERLPLSYRDDGERSVSLLWPLPFTPASWRMRATARLTLAGGSWQSLGLEGASYRSASLLVSPSMVRWLDWYAAAGQARFLDEGLAKRFAWEGGLHFRFKPLWFHNNLPLLGLRVGVQLREFRRPRDPRLVFEVGSGFM